MKQAFINFFKEYFKYIFLLALLYVPVFGYLDALTIRIWDEAWHVINAYEMSKDHNWIVTHFDGRPDMWSLKPPLMIWLQVIGIKILGFNELAIRLPSAVAALFVCFLLLFFSLKFIKDFWFGFIAIVILITTSGYIGDHAERTGDYDSLLTFFITAYCLLFFLYLDNKKTSYLYLMFIAVTLATLTKGVAGILFIPGLFIYALLQKEVILFLKNKHFYIGIAFFILIIGGYYFIREQGNPGYIATVLKSELGGRYMEVIEAHQGGFWFYFQNFLTRMSAWYLLIPCGFAVGFFHPETRIRKLSSYLFCVLLCYFLIISFAQTKLEWYDVPMYPLLAMMIAVFIHFIFLQIESGHYLKNTLRVNTLPFVFLFLVLIIPYEAIIEKTYKPVEKDAYYRMSCFLRETANGKHNVKNQLILNEGYTFYFYMYVKKLEEKGTPIIFKDKDELNAGDNIIVSQDSYNYYIIQKYFCETLSQDKNVIIYKILGKRSP